MTFIVVFNHILFVVNEKRPHKFWTKFLNSGHSGRLEKSGTFQMPACSAVLQYTVHILLDFFRTKAYKVVPR